MPSTHHLHLDPLPKSYEWFSPSDNRHSLESCMDTVKTRSAEAFTSLADHGFAPDSAFTYLFVGLASFAAGTICSREVGLINVLKNIPQSTKVSNELLELKPLTIIGSELSPTVASNVRSPLSPWRSFEVSQNHNELSALAKRLNRSYNPAAIHRTTVALESGENDVLEVGRTLQGVKTTFRHGHYTLQETSGRTWLHQPGHLRVPISDARTSWWHDAEEDATWVKTKHYVEKRHAGGGFYRNYKNGAVQIRRGNGEEFWESKFPERKRIWISHQEGISSRESFIRPNSLDK